jgi:ATP-dependent protease Clp ATPase subunit
MFDIPSTPHVKSVVITKGVVDGVETPLVAYENEPEKLAS